MKKVSDNLINFYVPKNELIFSPIGGVGQIGMNFYLYGTEGKWIVVDLGITFGNSDIVTEVVFPNLFQISSEIWGA